MISLLSHLMNGLSLGSVYAIIALGYTMVYGIAKMLNFAHGDVIMIGAYVSFCAVHYWNLPPMAALAVAMLACTVLGITIERLAYKPLRQATSLAVLITAIGISYLLQLTGAAELPATVLYPMVTGGSIIFSALSGRVFFKEKLSVYQLVSIGLCFVGTLLFL